MDIEKRIKKTANRTIKSYSPLVTYFWLVFNPLAVKKNMSAMISVLNDFFFLQFLEKFKIYKIPVVKVDHPLDNKIPFKPEKVSIYLDFINFWIRPFAMLKDRIGVKNAALRMRDWMINFKKLYIVAAKIYRYKLSTTDRPKYKDMIEFRQIHALDPHYLCVPSLHIATLLLVYAYFRKVFDEENFTQEEKDRWLTEIFNGAIEISDTVLYIKQHSVNCIGAAFYMVVQNFGDLVSDKDARYFMDNLFRTAEGFSEADAEEVRKYIIGIYEKFTEEQKTSENWYEPIHKFLDEYENLYKN